MSWFNPESPKTGTGSSVPKGRSYRAEKPSVTIRTKNGTVVPKPPKKNAAESASAVVRFFRGANKAKKK